MELLTTSPPADAIARMVAIQGVVAAPAMLARQRGPAGHLGPEAAGAVLVLQATFADEDKAAAFWHATAALMEQLAVAPGFIRRYNFADGPHYTLFAFWRTTEDAHAFFESAEHQAAMQDLFRSRWQYSHFAGLWEMRAPRPRLIFCQECDGVTPVGDRVCVGCGVELFDPYATHVPA